MREPSGKDHGAMAGFHLLDHRLERTPVGAFLINRDHIQLREKRAKNGPIQQRLAGKIEEFAGRGDAGQGRVEVALVIHREQAPALARNVIAAMRLEEENALGDDGGDGGADLVRASHGARNRQTCLREVTAG